VRKSERPTLAPAFDVSQYARDSDRRLRSAPTPAPPKCDAAGVTLKISETRLATRPRLGAFVTNEAWARSMVGLPYVAMANEALKRLPLDHRAGFVLSLMDGSIELETIIDLCGMQRDEALTLLRDLYESEIVRFK